jgi:CxxC motif-containing protein (DUF1111 family)
VIEDHDRRFSVVLAAFLGCSSSSREASDDATADPLEASEADLARAFGAPLPGLTEDERRAFDDGREEFEHVATVEDGLGPVFNDRSCAACHTAGAVGGASDRTVTRFGALTEGAFDPLTRLGGSLVNARGIGATGGRCFFAGEIVPPAATITTLRVTTPAFGLGLVDAVSDEVFLALATRQARDFPETRGRASRVTDIQSGATRIGKFGWKAQNPSVFQFAADAYANELGVTNPQFPEESCPQGDCAMLARCAPSAKHPNDDGTDVAKLAAFLSFLGAPPPLRATEETRHGQRLFFDTGCAQCHWTTLTTGPSAIAALDRVKFHPYSDFLLHDMGALGDGIAQGDASRTELRTAPLWGVRVRPRLLHDGRARTVDEAIRAHSGQAARSADDYAALSASDRAALVTFVNSL